MISNIIKTDILEVKDKTEKFVAIRIGGQLFALSAIAVEDVLMPQKITPVPLAPDAIVGLFNLRGRIVTAIDLRVKMGMEPGSRTGKSIVVSYQDNLYGFIVDEVTGVYDVTLSEIEHNPENLSEKWKEYCLGIYKTETELMVILNIEGLFK